MEEVIDFKENGNGKLNCEYFTMLRLYDPVKHCIGNRFEIRLNNIHKGFANIVSMNLITLGQIREYTARLDAGCSAEECQSRIKEAYKRKQINWNSQAIAYCLMKYAKNENKLFNEEDMR